MQNSSLMQFRKAEQMQISHLLANIVMVSILTVANIGCSVKILQTKYVVYDGFRGKFTIVQNQADGVPVKQSGDTYIYEIPPSGTLKLKGTDPALNRNESSEAYFKNGKQIPMPMDGLIKGQVGFMILDTDADGTTNFFVGTREEFDKLDYYGSR